MTQRLAFGDYYTYTAWLTALDQETKAKWEFYHGHKEAPELTIKEKRIRDRVDNWAGETGVTVRSGQWLLAEPKNPARTTYLTHRRI